MKNRFAEWGRLRSKRAISALLSFIIAGFGASLAFLSVLRLNKDAVFAPTSHYGIWVFVAGGVGALVALQASIRLFGGRGFLGATSAIWGSIYLSVIGSLVAGTLILPIYGTMFGPLTLVGTLADTPLFALAWSLVLFFVHISMMERRESAVSGFRAT